MYGTHGTHGRYSIYAIYGICSIGCVYGAYGICDICDLLVSDGTLYDTTGIDTWTLEMPDISDIYDSIDGYDIYVY